MCRRVKACAPGFMRVHQTIYKIKLSGYMVWVDEQIFEFIPIHMLRCYYVDDVFRIIFDDTRSMYNLFRFLKRKKNILSHFNLHSVLCIFCDIECNIVNLKTIFSTSLCDNGNQIYRFRSYHNHIRVDEWLLNAPE